MSVTLEKRVAALEAQIALLQQRQGLRTAASRAWVDDLYGKFAGDPLFAQAMKLGRRYRKSKLGRTVARKAKPRR